MSRTDLSARLGKKILCSCSCSWIGSHICLAINIAQRSPEQYTECIINVDNKASIQAIKTPKQQSRQYIIRNIHQTTDQIKDTRPNLEFKIEWIPGHMEIEGNEKADNEAKRAALEKLTEEPLISYKLKSVQNAKINTDINTEAKKAWTNGTSNATQLRKLTRPYRVKTGVQPYGDLSRKQKHQTLCDSVQVIVG